MNTATFESRIKNTLLSESQHETLLDLLFLCEEMDRETERKYRQEVDTADKAFTLLKFAIVDKLRRLESARKYYKEMSTELAALRQGNLFKHNQTDRLTQYNWTYFRKPLR